MKRFLYLSLILFLAAINISHTQTQQANPANWLFRGGNASGTKHQAIVSDAQVLDSFQVKWSTSLISGDITPLVGNLVNNNNRVNSLPYAPNEMAAYVGDTLFIIDGFGKVYSRYSLFDHFNWINEITCLFDTTQTNINNSTSRNHLIGLSTLEYKPKDSVANAYIVGYDEQVKASRVLSRLAVNVSKYTPNDYVSIIPVGGQIIDNQMNYFAIINQAHPSVDSDYVATSANQPYYRGIANFVAAEGNDVYPFKDIGDSRDNRFYYAGDASQGYTSFKKMHEKELTMLVPCKPTSNLGATTVHCGDDFTSTYTDVPYSTAVTYSSEDMLVNFNTNLATYVTSGQQPFINSYFVDINDNETATEGFVLISEGYNGLAGSQGTPKLYIADIFGDILTDGSMPALVPFKGTENHTWSVAVGNIDGFGTNEYLPYYPNNPGNEIIVTQSSIGFAVPSSKLFVLRYNTYEVTEKPDGSGRNLFDLDTICSYQVNGWVAAVNDIDGKPDKKDEIILVDGSTVMVLGMRDYNEDEFRSGSPFDTLIVRDFPFQTISYLSVVDIDGDRKNDIIVTTHDSTYVLGAIVPNTLNVKLPNEYNALYCIGDTVHIEWENYIAGQDFVDIIFRPYENGIPVPSDDTLIIGRHPNPNEIGFYDYHADRKIIGKNGRFIVSSVSKPQYQIDSTAVLKFSNPEIWITTDFEIVYEMGAPITFTGATYCNDSILVQYMDIDSTWVDWDVFWDPDFYDYSFDTYIPCVSLFNCTGVDSVPPVLHCRHILYKSVFIDTLSYFDIKVKPYQFPMQWTKSEKANPNLEFTWDHTEIEMPVDTLIFSFSLDEGETWQGGVRLDVTADKYYWRIPDAGPMQALIRFCCEHSCVRTDTLLQPWLPQFINIVAPNPFTPYQQVAQIVYQCPKDTKVDILIFDQNNRMVAHPVKSKFRRANIMYTDTWDGIREFDNSPCAIGMYYVIFQLEDGQKEIHPVFIKK